MIDDDTFFVLFCFGGVVKKEREMERCMDMYLQYIMIFPKSRDYITSEPVCLYCYETLTIILYMYTYNNMIKSNDACCLSI